MFTTGTADGHIDLLEKVRKYLVDEVGWTEMDYDGSISPSPDDDTDMVHLSLRAPGALTGHEFFLNITTEHDLANGRYGWKMSAATDWEEDLADQSQVMASPFCYFNTWQNSIDYWIYASTRRFVLVAKCNTSYMSMYAGLFLPFALPTEYLKPFMICGNSDRLESYNEPDAGNRFIVGPGEGNCYALNLNGDDWLSVFNTRRAAGSNISLSGAAADAIVWPHRSTHKNGTGGISDSVDWNTVGFLNFRPNLQGESPQFLCHLMSSLESHMMGVLDGVYLTAGFGRTSEQELTIDDRTYRVFQNIFRTTARDFMSIEEY